MDLEDVRHQFIVPSVLFVRAQFASIRSFVGVASLVISEADGGFEPAGANVTKERALRTVDFHVPREHVQLRIGAVACGALVRPRTGRCDDGNA